MTDAVRVEIIEFPMGNVSKHKLCMTDANGNTITANLSDDCSEIKNLIDALCNTVKLGSDMKVPIRFIVEEE